MILISSKTPQWGFCIKKSRRTQGKGKLSGFAEAISSKDIFQ